MKKATLAVLLTLPLSGLSMACAADVGTPTPITFYNNTTSEVQITEDGFDGGMFGCTGNPYNICLVQQAPLTLNPHTSGVIQLVSAVQNSHIYQGGVGFQITTDGSSMNTVTIPVMADPAGAFALTNVCNGGSGCLDGNSNAEISSYAINALPQYVVSVVQNIENTGGPAQQTAVVINPLH